MDVSSAQPSSNDCLQNNSERVKNTVDDRVIDIQVSPVNHEESAVLVGVDREEEEITNDETDSCMKETVPDDCCREEVPKSTESEIEIQDSGNIESNCELLEEETANGAQDDLKVLHSPTKTNNSSEDKYDSIYHIKWVLQNGHKNAIVTQNENGPCPLIALINVLILRGQINLPSQVDIVTTAKLMEYLGDCILDSIPKNITEGTQLNYEQNVHDAMAVLPKLQTGLDVNVKFSGISDFEYTPECIIFDLLRIPLYHGWLIDPQMLDVLAAVGKCSYNQLVEKIINTKSSLDPDKATDALVAENFLEKTASQLTYHGLCELTSHLKENELCVLFRNNHFSSLIKHKNCLYQLVTDQGFLNENVVWETLTNIDGDGQFVDADFILVPPKPLDVSIPPNVSEEQQIDQDYLVALTLQEEQHKQENNEQEWEEFKKKKLGVSNGLTDEELARRLQQEEIGERNNQPQVQPVQPPSNTRNRNRDCVVL